MNEALDRPLAGFAIPSDRHQSTWILTALAVSFVLHMLSVVFVKTRPVLAETTDIVTVDIQQTTTPPPEVPPPPPPVEKQPEPVVQPTPRPLDNEPPPPPAAAKAGNLLTAAEDVPSQKNDMVDFTHGEGDWGYGATSATGTAIHGVPSAVPSGVVGGTGNGPPPPPPPPPAPTVDLSHRAKLLDNTSHACEGFYPSEADDDNGAVTMLINITADGVAQSVVIQSESPQGQGFGAAARRCFLGKKKFFPALDKLGNPIGKSEQVTITFLR